MTTAPPLLFAVASDDRLLVFNGESERLPGVGDLPVATTFGIGELDGRACLASDVGEPPAGFRSVPLRRLFGAWDERTWTMAGRAVQLVQFHRTHRFCGRCGAGTTSLEAEQARRCAACALVVYPRLSPAVIVLVERGDELLLARGNRHPAGTFSALAGFVEPGETLEEAAVREVREEVGVDIRDLRYVASQPWPFPHSLMVGFRATWAGGGLHVDGTEILEAGWFRRATLPDVPPPPTIARKLIDAWLLEHP
jgi:NAD+ diphosphatase